MTGVNHTSAATTGPLLPCPFCGSTSVDPEGWMSSDKRTGPACDECGGSTDTVERWNARVGVAQAASDPARDRILEAIADLQGEHEVMAGPFDPTKWKIEVSVADLQAVIASQPPAAPVETMVRDTLIAAQVALADGGIESTPFTRDALERINEALAIIKAAPQCSSAGTEEVSFPCGRCGAVLNSDDPHPGDWCIDCHMTIGEAFRLLEAEDGRQDRLHELLETIREQIRLHVAPEHRPDGLFKNIQDAVYAMRGRTRLADDAAITNALGSKSNG